MGDLQVLDREVYYTSEAARLLGIATATLANWLDGYTRSGTAYPPVLRDDPRPSNGRRVVTWGEFVEAGHLAAYRRKARIPLQRLRAYVDDWRSERGVPYPLAHRKPRVGPDRQLLDHDDDLVWRHKDGQAQMPSPQSSVDAFFGRIDFDDDIASRYWPAGRGVGVVVDPTRQFGSPIIPGTRIRTATLHGMHVGGDPAGWLASAYSLETAQVEAAIDFERRLANRAIAAYVAA